MIAQTRRPISLSIFVLVLCSSATYTQKKISRSITVEQTPVDFEHEPTISIWIHGTQLMSKKETHGTHIGLKSVSTLTPIEPLHAAAHRAHKETDPVIHEMYSFIWSGKLSFKSRLKAATLLYNQLEQVIQNYYAIFNIYPKIRLITHSHGGNVALNLARIHENLKGSLTTIHELILLACPVQRETSSYLEHSLFESVYALYSKIDLVQVIDPQGFYDGNIFHIFSKRRFDWHQKLLQAEIRINHKRLTHTMFQKESFLDILPCIIDALQVWNTTTNENTAQTRLKMCILCTTKNS